MITGVILLHLLIISGKLLLYFLKSSVGLVAFLIQSVDPRCDLVILRLRLTADVILRRFLAFETQHLLRELCPPQLSLLGHCIIALHMRFYRRTLI